MRKQCFSIILIAILLILVGCNNDIITNNEVAKLSNIKPPNRLQILNPNLNKENQRLAVIAGEISALLDNSDNLSDEEKKELEEKINNYTLEVDEFQNQIIKIDSQDVIENIFNKIRDSKGTYEKYLSEDLLRNSNYYSMQIFYDGVGLQTKSLEDGYIFLAYIFEDNTLVFFDKLFDGGAYPREIKVQFDYEWFSRQVEKENDD